MPSYRGLYYPYIHFQDEGWLKAAALYWDEMSRIVPAGVRRSDSDEVQRLQDAEFVRNQPPGDAAKKIAGAFRQVLRSRDRALSKKFGIGWFDSSRKLSDIFDEKFDKELLHDLLNLKLVRQRDRWIGMHPQLANVYMTALAEAMAPDIGARPVAEQSRDHIAISGLTLERLTDALLGTKEPLRSDIEVEELMATVALRHVVPADPSSIPAQEIIEFRKTHNEERGAFQAEISKIVKELDYVKDMKDAAEVQRHLQSEYEKRLAGKLRRLEEGMRRAKWDVVDSALAASWTVPTALTAAFWALGLTVPAAVTTGIGVVVGGWSIYRKRSKAVADVVKPTSECYLYRVKKALSPEALTRELQVTRGLYIA